MTDLLNLRSLRTLSVADDGQDYVVKAEGRDVPQQCPDPQCVGMSLYGHGSEPQSIMDTPAHGKRTKIEIERKRYRCQGCRKTFFEPIPDIDAKRQATARLVAYVEQRCLKQTFLSLGRDVGLDEKTIRNIFDDYIKRLEAIVKFEVPEFLGIDELKVVKQYRAVITNIGKNSLYDILPTRRQDALMQYFSQLSDRDRIQCVAMDMWKPYRNVVTKCLPQAQIVVDKFHIQRMANEVLEKVRKQIRKKVSTRQRLKLKDDRFLLLRRLHDLNQQEYEIVKGWIEDFPRLGAAYVLKEGFFSIWDARSRAEAEQRYAAWKATIQTDLLPDFKPLLQAMHNWNAQIFNYFDQRITNAYTESINNLIKGMNRMGRGYSFDVLRARLLYNEEARKATTVRTSARKRAAQLDRDNYAMFMRDSTNITGALADEKIIEYGPSIPILAKLLNDGYFD